jgi:hypothetical protein
LVAASEALPGRDLEPLTAFLYQPPAYGAIRGYCQALRADPSTNTAG